MPHRAGLILVLVAACSGGSANKPAEPAPAGPRDRALAGCKQMFARQRDCTDTFIPALVGWRVELDVPAGVAELDKTSGRDALVTKAKEEWAASNTDDQFAAMCTGIIGDIPDDQLGGMVEAGERCNATTTCDEFVACVEPFQRQRLAAQKSAESPAPPP
jgi:hypothetical protein